MLAPESQEFTKFDDVVLNNDQDFVEAHGSLVSRAEDFRNTVEAGKKVTFENSLGQISRCLTTAEEVNAWEKKAKAALG